MLRLRSPLICVCLLCLSLMGLMGCGVLVRSSEPPVPRHPLTRWHKTDWLATPWRLTVQGVEIRRAGVERTEGKPRTALWIWDTWHRPLNRWSQHYQVPVELLIALIATESAPAKGQPFYTRDPRSLRREKGFISLERTPHRISVGLTQVSVATARAVLALEGIDPALVDDQWLMSAENGIRTGAALVARQARGELSNVATYYDPPVVFAAYNAGGLYRMGGWQNRWKMRQYPARTGKHVDRAVHFYNDAVAMLRTHPIAPVFSHRQYLYQLPPWHR